MSKEFAQNDLLVFSHLRWNFVFQRPQHLMRRYAKQRRVFFVEEPIFEEISYSKIHTHQSEDGVFVITPYLPIAISRQNQNTALQTLLDDLLVAKDIHDYSIWYNTPMSLQFTRHLKPKHILFDIVDELSLFKGASPLLNELETELLEKADLVFTGGQSLYKAKRFRHKNIHPFPNSIDKVHFGQARLRMTDPTDQQKIPHPRIGYYGVIDERIDKNLIAELADLRPDFQFVMVGPIVNIDSSSLPKAKNIHYLGQKNYRELPQYVSGWDTAMLPFVLNESTRFVSPTSTPEFLAAGLPVVSTAIEDVMSPYGDENLVYIVHSAEEFADSLVHSLKDRKNIKWQIKVDSFLADISWDSTFKSMVNLENQIGMEVEKSSHKIHPSPNYKPTYTVTS